MSHELSRKQVPVSITEAQRQRIRDSLLVIIVFAIGLLGSCYILHFALSRSATTSFFHQDTPAAETEMVYLTGE